MCGCRIVGHNGHCLGKVRIGMSAEGHMRDDHRGNENYNTSAGDALGSVNTRNGGGVSNTEGNIPPTVARSEKPRNRS